MLSRTAARFTRAQPGRWVTAAPAWRPPRITSAPAASHPSSSGDETASHSDSPPATWRETELLLKVQRLEMEKSAALQRLESEKSFADRMLAERDRMDHIIK